MIEPVRDARPSLPAVRADDPRTAAEAVLFEIRRVIVGQDAMLERVLVALLAGRPPAPRGRARPRQDADDPDPRRRPRRVVPAHPVHARTSSRPTSSAPASTAPTGTFDTELGPVFCNFLLADEINRAPAKVQSALLEVMQERQVTIGRESHAVPRPFLVMATQNPIESEGTYPLPEAQVDRFMMKVVVGYPTRRRGGDRRRALAPPRRRGPRDPRRRRARGPPGRDPEHLRRPGDHRLRRRDRRRDPRARPRRPGRSSRATSRSAPARAARSTSSTPPARSRCSAAAATSSRPTSPSSPPTSCATASSRASRPSPRRSPPDMILAQIVPAVPAPRLITEERTA